MKDSVIYDIGSLFGDIKDWVSMRKGGIRGQVTIIDNSCWGEHWKGNAYKGHASVASPE